MNSDGDAAADDAEEHGCDTGADVDGGTAEYTLRAAILVGPTDGWEAIEVPGCWTMQGHDRPQYTNIQMPFPGRPPTVPDANPTGVHRRTVTLPASWAGRRLVVHVAGAETVLYVHVDGRPIAMGKDSRLPHEVDLTGVVEPGVPFELALTVVRWSDATYLEDQDHWHHAGLHRSVFAYATPTTHVADVHATADYDPTTGAGRLRTVVWLGADGHGPKGWTARVDLAVDDGRTLTATAPARFEHPTDALTTWLVFDGRRAVVEIDVADVAPWSAEVPTRHHLVVTLLDGSGTEVDVVSPDVGFRRVEVVGQRVPGERPGRAGQGRQPPRPRPAPGQGRDPGGHRGRPGADEAARHQRRAHVELPERRPPLRRLRSPRPLRGRRGRPRGPRLPAQPHQGPPLGRGDPGARDPHGPAGQEPPVDHRVVARQRERERPRARGGARLAPGLGPVAARPVREQHR